MTIAELGNATATFGGAYLIFNFAKEQSASGSYFGYASVHLFEAKMHSQYRMN